MLTVDIGNTHIKWALWERGDITRKGVCAFSKQAPGHAFDIWKPLQPQRRVVVACVAGEMVAQALKDWVRTQWSVEAEFLHSVARQQGVTNAYPDPEQYGVDRWAALLGAHALYRVPVCIIDAGTAITVDLLEAGGVHRGGRILPGLQMMTSALLDGADGIQRTDGMIVAFADNTADAVSSGTLHMLRAALAEICESAGQQLGSDMKIIITGGMSELIMSLPGLPAMLHQPDLVLIGLHAAAEARGEGS